MVNLNFVEINKGEKNMETKSFVLMVLVVIAVASMWEVKLGDAAAPSAAQCKQQRTLAVNACKPVIFGKLPSPVCCQRARVTNFECVCPYVTPKLAALVDLNRIIRLIEGCGRKVPRHLKCGSKLFLYLHIYNYIYIFKSIY